MEQGNDTRPVAEGYEILERLGRGGTSDVWKARQLSLDRPVALKVLAADRLAEPGSKDAFRQEAVAAAKVDLGGVVRVLDFGECADGRLWYAMEYVEGQSLADWLATHRRMAAGEVLTLAGIVAETLGALWRQYGLVHCDVKPGNLLIGKDGSVKLADFGLARYAGTAGARGDEDLEGTPTYLAPEQIETGAADCRSDMYALGLTLYHALTGCEPFNGRTLADVLEAQATDYLKDPCEVAPDTPTGFAWLLHKLTAKDPGLRPETWEDVAKDVAQIRGGHMPLPPYPKEGESTILLNPERMAGRSGKLSNGTRNTVVVVGTQTGKWIESHGAEMKRGRRGGGGKGCLGFLAFVLVVAGVAVGLWFKAGKPEFWKDIGKTPAEKYVPPPEEEEKPEVHGSAESAAVRPEGEEAETAAADADAAPAGEADVPEETRKRFVEAADLFNGALATWQSLEEMDEAAREDELPGIEADARAAAEMFEELAGKLPAEMPARTYANQCYQLAKDARKARVPQGERRLAFAGKRHDETRSPWPTPEPGFAGIPMQLGYAWDYLPVPSGRDDAMEFMMLMIRAGVEGNPVALGDGTTALLFGSLKWMMPLEDAMKVLRVDPKGTRRHVAEGAVFPFGGVFAIEAPAGRAGQGKYGKMRILGDADGRLVGVELYEEEPAELLNEPLKFVDGQRTLDFVTGRMIPEKGKCRVFQQALQGQGTVRIDCEAADFAEGEESPRPVWRSMLILPRGLAECCVYHVMGGRED